MRQVLECGCPLPLSIVHPSSKLPPLINTQQTVLPWWGERWHVSAFAAFVASSILYIVARSISSSVTDWVRSFVLITALIASLVTLGRQLPLQNVLAVALVFGIAGATWEAVTNHLAFLWWEPPWRAAVFWGVVLINGRSAAQFLLRSRRGARTYGWELIAVAALIVAAIAATLYRSRDLTALAI